MCFIWDGLSASPSLRDGCSPGPSFVWGDAPDHRDVERCIVAVLKELEYGGDLAGGSFPGIPRDSRPLPPAG